MEFSIQNAKEELGIDDDRLRKVFDAFDTENMGGFGIDGLKAGLSRLLVETNDEELNAIFERIKNSEGVVTLEEFLKFLQSLNDGTIDEDFPLIDDLKEMLVKIQDHKSKNDDDYDATMLDMLYYRCPFLHTIFNAPIGFLIQIVLNVMSSLICLFCCPFFCIFCVPCLACLCCFQTFGFYVSWKRSRRHYEELL